MARTTTRATSRTKARTGRAKASTGRAKTGRRRYGKAAGSKVKAAMSERKRGTLRSGRSGRRVTSRKQAVAIGLSQARKAGAKVPKKRSRSASR